MIRKLLAKYQELSSGGDGSRSLMPPGPNFGNKNMPRIGRRRIISECQDRLGAHTFGNFLGRIKTLFNNIVFGKSEQGTMLDFGGTAGNKNSP